MVQLLSDPIALDNRRAMLAQPAMAPLRRFAADIRARHGPTPDFDPADGGVGARLLLVLETPGTSIGKTGFVSADNATGTAANLRRFLAAAEIGRREIAIWNAVPFVIHTGGPNRAPRMAEIRCGLELLPPLLSLLPNLCCIVLSGRVAGMAEPVIRRLHAEMPVIRIPHPSPVYVCTSPEIRRRIGSGLQAAAATIATENLCTAQNHLAPIGWMA